MWSCLAIFVCVVFLANAQTDPFRPQFHVMPTKNWMNDPNGPAYYKGYYHLFYQYNPGASFPYNMHWGHSISKNFVSWQNLPDALSPSMPYDLAGVWSGSITISASGIPTIFYTGQLTNGTEMQCVALPKDPSDPMLVEWVKASYNPILSKPPPQGNPSNFRDPSTAYFKNGVWHLVVGTEYANQGAGLLYTSQDFLTWNFVNPLYTSPKYGNGWECPDFFLVDKATPDSYIFKASAGGYGDIWVIGDLDATGTKFTPAGDVVSVSYGQCYASKSFLDPVKDRNIQWSWIAEEDGGGPARGWQGVMSLPNQIGIDRNFKIPTSKPIEDLFFLRKDQKHYANVAVTDKPAILNGAMTNQGEILVEFNTKLESGGLFGVRILDNGTHYTEISYTMGTDGSVQLQLDRSHSGTTGQSSTQGGKISLLPSDLDSLTLHIFIDHSIVEVYGHGGRARITSRIYVTHTPGISLVSSVPTVATADVYTLGTIWT